jgi:hypothetical protein
MSAFVRSSAITLVVVAICLQPESSFSQAPEATVFPLLRPGVALVGDQHASVPPDGARPPELALPATAQTRSPLPPPGFVYAGTGPYYGNYSDPGYSAVTGKVWLPCHAANLRPGETGYVYMGGFGWGYAGSAVDAGFQLSSGNHGTFDGSHYDNYALIFKHGTGGEPGWPRRLVCDQLVTYTFKTLSTTKLIIEAKDVKTWSSNTTQAVETATVTITIEPWENWLPSGGVLGDLFKGVIVKRMVSIAQPQEWSRGAFPNWWRDGSYFGHSVRSKIPLVKFTDCSAGREVGGELVWVPCTQSMRHSVWYPTDEQGATIRPSLTGKFPASFAVAVDLGP